MDDAGVTDIVGTILMVALTVSMMVGLSVLVLGFDGPPDKVHADLRVELNAGGLLWGDGNEEISLRHVGGESVRTQDTRIVVAINGTTQSYSGGALDQGFADGLFSLGDYWNITMLVPATAAVEVSVINKGANQVVGLSRLAADTSAAGTGPSTITYVSGSLVHTGSLSGFSAAQSADDAGATARITEDSAPGGNPTVRFDPGYVAGSTSVPGSVNVLTSNNVRAVFDDAGDKVRVAGFDMPGNAQTIQSVKIGFEGHKGGGGGPNGNPQMRYTYTGVPGATPSTGTATLSSSSDASFLLDVTGDKAGWTVADIEGMEISIERLSADNAARDADVDHLFVEVRYMEGSVSDGDVEFSFAGVPAGATHQIQVRYMTSGDTFALQVYDGTSWNQRGNLASGAFSLFTYTLSPAEYQSGSPAIRFVDRDTGASAGTLEIDYARVQSV